MSPGADDVRRGLTGAYLSFPYEEKRNNITTVITFRTTRLQHQMKISFPLLDTSRRLLFRGGVWVYLGSKDESDVDGETRTLADTSAAADGAVGAGHGGVGAAEADLESGNDS